jgi:hypothetical protein
VRTKLSEILKIFFAIVVALAITTSISAQEPDVPPEQPDSGPEEGKGLSGALDCLCEELKKLKELLEAERDKEEK